MGSLFFIALLLLLTIPAIMGSSAALFDVRNGRTAVRTRFSFPAVDIEIFLILPFFTAGIDEVDNSRAAIGKSFF